MSEEKRRVERFYMQPSGPKLFLRRTALHLAYVPEYTELNAPCPTQK